MGHYTMFSKYGNCTRLLKIKNKLKNWLFSQIKSRRILDILWVFLMKQLFHSRLLEMKSIIVNSYPTHTRGIIVN